MIKNWDPIRRLVWRYDCEKQEGAPFVFGPELAIAKIPAPVNLSSGWISSSLQRGIDKPGTVDVVGMYIQLLTVYARPSSTSTGGIASLYHEILISKLVVRTCAKGQIVGHVLPRWFDGKLYHYSIPSSQVLWNFYTSIDIGCYYHLGSLSEHIWRSLVIYLWCVIPVKLELDIAQTCLENNRLRHSLVAKSSSGTYQAKAPMNAWRHGCDMRVGLHS